MCKEDRYLYDWGIRKDFQSITSRVNRIKEKMDSLGHVQI